MYSSYYGGDLSYAAIRYNRARVRRISRLNMNVQYMPPRPRMDISKMASIESSSSPREYFPVIIMGICVIGAAYQCLSVTWEYSQYQVVSDLSVGKPIDIKPPAFSLCMWYHNLIDYKRLLPILDVRHNLSVPQIVKTLQENLKIADILKALPNLISNKTLKYRMARIPGTYDVTENADALSIEQFIKNDYACYMFTMIGGRNVTLKSKHVTYGREGGALMMASFYKANLSAVSGAAFYLHPADMFPRGDRDFRMFVSAKGSQLFAQSATYWSLSYQEIELRLLEYPYTTGCRDFRSLGFEGPHHCQLSCAHELAMANYGKSLFTLSHNEPQNYTVISKFSIIENVTLLKEVEEWDRACDAKCFGVNCAQTLYAPKIESQLDHDTDIVFRIVEPSSPFIKNEFKAKITLMTYVVSILSLLGVWLGFSFMTAIRIAYSNSRKIVIKFAHY